MFPNGDLFPEFNPERDPFNSCDFLAKSILDEDIPLTEIYAHLEGCENCRAEIVSDHFMYQNYHDALFAGIPEGLGLEDFFRTFVLQERELRNIYSQVRESLKRKIFANLRPLVSLMESINRILRYRAEGPGVLLDQEFPILMRKYQRLIQEYGRGEAFFLLGVTEDGYGQKTEEAFEALLLNWRAVLGIEGETTEAS